MEAKSTLQIHKHNFVATRLGLRSLLQEGAHQMERGKITKKSYYPNVFVVNVPPQFPGQLPRSTFS